MLCQAAAEMRWIPSCKCGVPSADRVAPPQSLSVAFVIAFEKIYLPKLIDFKVGDKKECTFSAGSPEHALVQNHCRELALMLEINCWGVVMDARIRLCATIIGVLQTHPATLLNNSPQNNHNDQEEIGSEIARVSLPLGQMGQRDQGLLSGPQGPRSIFYFQVACCGPCAARRSRESGQEKARLNIPQQLLNESGTA